MSLGMLAALHFFVLIGKVQLKILGAVTPLNVKLYELMNQWDNRHSLLRAKKTELQCNKLLN